MDLMYEKDENRFRNIGKISEIGLINSLDRDGMNIPKSLLELFGNSIDSYNDSECDKIIKVEINNDCISVTDYGCGFTMEKADDAFSLYESMHTNDKSIGVSGYGLKSSTKKLSNNGKTIIQSIGIDGNPVIIHIPWDEIIDKKKYTGNVKISNMNDTEKCKYLEKLFPHNTGTTITFSKSESVYDNLIGQFSIDRKYENPITERFEWAFGKIPNVHIYCDDNIEGKKHEWKPYNPTGLSPDNYLFGTNGYETKQIGLYQSQKDKSDILFATPVDESDENNNKYIYYQNNGSGLKKTTKKTATIAAIPKKYKQINNFTLTMSCVKPKKEYFDEDCPKEPTNTGLGPVSNYEEQFYGKNSTSERNNKMPLIRNNSRIGTLTLGPPCQQGGAGSSKDKFAKLHIQSELDYDTYSSQNNPTDTILGIQKTKHTLTQDNSMKGLLRLCDNHRSNFVDKLWERMKNNEYEEQQPVEEVQPVEQEPQPIEEPQSVHEEQQPIEESQPVEEEPQSVHEEQQPVEEPPQVEEQQPVEELQPVEEEPQPIEEPQPAEEEQQPAEEEQQPIEEQQPAEEEQQPIEEPQPVEEPPQPYEEPQQVEELQKFDNLNLAPVDPIPVEPTFKTDVIFTKGKDNIIVVSDSKSKLMYCSVKHKTKYCIIEEYYRDTLKNLGEERFKQWAKEQEKLNNFF